MVHDQNKIKMANGNFSTDSRNIQLKINAYHKGGGIKELNIYRNGKLVRNIDGEKLSEINELGNGNIEVDAEMTNGVNQFKVVAKNFDDVDSKRDIVNVLYTGATILTADLHIISVGINEYENSLMNLNYAFDDAKAVVDAIKVSEKKLYKNIFTYELYNENATKEKILNAFNEVASNAKMNDVFIFYYAGHGLLIETDAYEGEYVLVPH